MVKEDEKTLKKRKSSPDPKMATSKKRRAATPELNQGPPYTDHSPTALAPFR
jgi:hypothetical protein